MKAFSRQMAVFMAASVLYGCGNPDTDGLGASDSGVDASGDWALDTLVAETVAPDSPVADTEAGPCVMAAKCAKELEICGSSLVCKCGILAPFDYAERAACPPSPDAGPEVAADAVADATPSVDADAVAESGADAGAVCAAFGPCPFPSWTCTTASGLSLTCAACKVWLSAGFMCPPLPADAGPADIGAADAASADTRAADAAPTEVGAAETGGSPTDTALADASAVDTGSPSDTNAGDTHVAETSSADTGASDTGSSADTTPADTGAADTGSSGETAADTGSVADAGTDTGVADTGMADTGASDTGSADTGSDAGSLLVALTFSWTPPAGYTQVGPVRVVGGYFGGPAWDPLCTMSVTSGSYSCVLSFVKGTTVTFVVEYANEALPAKKGWVFDRGCYPGGGCKKDFGSFTLKSPGGVGYPYLLKWNGYAPAPPSEVTFNGEFTVS